MNKKPLIILDLANNHMGSIEHGLQVIDDFSQVKKNHPKFEFVLKFQYRDLDSYIHDKNENNKYIKRFLETRLSDEAFEILKQRAVGLGFKTACTPFDERSVDKIVKQKFDYIKIASCAINDWRLVRKIKKLLNPEQSVVASVGVATENELVKFFSILNAQETNIMHCVPVYPTPDEEQGISKILWLRERFSPLRVGFSSHEPGSSSYSVALAVAAGARVFERHIGLETEKFSLNDYSCSPLQLSNWVGAIEKALEVSESNVTEDRIAKSQRSLDALKRGFVVNRNISKGEEIKEDDLDLTFPCQEGQLSANEDFHLVSLIAQTDLQKDQRLFKNAIIGKKNYMKVGILNFLEKLNQLKIPLSSNTEFEMSYHYGEARFQDYGMIILNSIQLGYTKKLLFLSAGQSHPEQYHLKRDEVITVLDGHLKLFLNDQEMNLFKGDIVQIRKGDRHIFMTDSGVLMEEISSDYDMNDSIYTDSNVLPRNQRKKTYLHSVLFL